MQTRQHESGRIRAHNFNLDVIFKPAATWSLIGMTSTMVRYTEKGALFSSGAPSLFAQPNDLEYMLGILNTKICTYFQELLNPTINANSGDVLNYPIIKVEMSELVAKAISIAKLDWDLRENSMDFKRSPLMTDYRESCRKNIIDSILVGWDWPSKYNIENNLSFLSQYNIFRDYWSSLFLELHKTEQEINRITIDAYCLTDELQATLPFTEITILQEELVESSRKENRVEFNDSIIAQQFVSYGVGCLMGRYSVEIDGLVLADLNATIDDFKTIIPNARFLPDEDGILPLTDEDDFSDDLPTAFKSWLRFISGEHYDDNLRWIEDRLGKDLRSFFDRDFYKDHIKRYKSRPIYWMVSSPSGAYRALIYLHRYTKDTVGKILNDYVRPYRTKIEQKIRGLESIMDSAGSSAGDKTKAKKRLAQLEKYKIEIEAWEKDSLYPMALKRIELDLDDGVKVNYRKLQGILEPVKQLEAKEED